MDEINKKVAIVDIDGTLWSLAEPWHEELKKINPECPFPGQGGWDFWKGYVTEDELVQTCNAVHYRQYDFKPFDYAARMVAELKCAGFYVIIASHREELTYSATKTWLDDNNILYDELIVGSKIKGRWDKASLFDKHNVIIFIDDSPKELSIALEQGIECFSIEYEYNKHLDKDGVTFGTNDKELYEKVTTWLSWVGLKTN